MKLLQKLIYSLISGISAVVPVSARGHQVLLLRLFGQNARDPVLDLSVQLGLVLALVFCFRGFLSRLSRELRISKRYSRVRSRQGSSVLSYDLRLLRTALVPSLAVMLLLGIGVNIENRPILLSLFFILYGTVLYIFDHIRQGNKDSQSMSALDSVMIGLAAGFSVVPGFSRVGMQLCAAIGRGADRQKALSWILILGIPAGLLMIIFDLAAIVGSSVSGFGVAIVLSYILSAAASFAGGCIGVLFMRFLIVRGNLAGFGYYCWGASLLSFVLYLIV